MVVTSDDAWRWTVRGIGGIAGMLLHLHQDSAAGPMPEASLEYLEKQLRTLNRIAQEQRSQQPKAANQQEDQPCK